jgi:DNA (cytosine-5)-methyltransferase 1
MNYRVLDLFSAAAGGWSLGMHRAGFTTVAACEFVDWRRALYQENNPNVRIYDDVRTLTADRILRDCGFLPDIVVGSPPCQDISSANTRGKGVEGEKSGLFFEAIRIIGEVRPRWFALENSDRVRTRGYDRIAAGLEAHGYDCWPLVVGVGNAGGSHQRKRAWIIGLDTNAASEQGRDAGLSRVDANAGSAGREQEGRGRAGRWRISGEEACGGVGYPLGSDANSDQLRVECGAGQGWQTDGKEAVISGLSRVFRGPIGSADLSSHLRAYDGLPGWVAERCREAYGDAVAPQITEAIGRAILRTEAALRAIYSRNAA